MPAMCTSTAVLRSWGCSALDWKQHLSYHSLCLERIFQLGGSARVRAGLRTAGPLCAAACGMCYRAGVCGVNFYSLIFCYI